MGKKTDKMYITASEWEHEFGGAKKQVQTNYKKLPFNCCSLSFTPFENPVCTVDGTVFDLMAIVPWLKKYGTNPIDGKTLDPKSLIRLHFTKNNDGEYCCPITFKVFNNNTHIVAIKTSGNVYCFDAVQKLNIDNKNWKDLLTDEKFTRKDIITIQDPHRIGERNMMEFDFVKKGLQTKSDAAIVEESKLENSINMKGSTSRILQEMESKDLITKKEKKVDITPSFVATEKKTHNQAHFSTGLSAYSLTSMAFTPHTKQVVAHVSDEEYLMRVVNEKALVSIKTIFGTMNFELYCKECPKACYNFVQLAKQGYYNGTKFHRSIRNFMIQGGDPTGTGAGGKSIWGTNFHDEFHPSLKHDARGCLSMANRGKDTNGSQFFITYSKAMHLDNKHTMFGKLVGGMEVLDTLEAIGTKSNDAPEQDITINEVVVYKDPYHELLHKEEIMESEKQKKQKERERKQALIMASKGTVSSTDEVGKYMTAKRPVIPSTAESHPQKKKKTGFGLISSVLAIVPPLSTAGNQIVDSTNTPVHLHCSAWSGAHMQDFLTFGLEFQSIDYLVSLIKKANFNCIRLEFSAQMVRDNPVVNAALLKPNPSLIGKTAIDIYQHIVSVLTANEIMVILDYHMMDAEWCCVPDDDNGLWYNERWTEDAVMQQLGTMVQLNANNPWVIGVDLRNEIRPALYYFDLFGKKVLNPFKTQYPTWGTGLKTDWKAASERLGNMVLSHNPNALIFIQGLFVLDTTMITSILGGTADLQHLHCPQNLQGVFLQPVSLNVPNKVVYSVHSYEWHYNFKNWTATSYEEWKEAVNTDWGYLLKDHPIWLGEFGTNVYSQDGNVWWQFLLRFIKETKVHWSVWELAGIEQRATGETNTYGVFNPSYTDFASQSYVQTLQTLMF
ncbi:Peptidyl-prolyl cis-trans isomerase cyp8 [Boothiomyces sp. JEL0838]|nr:Peptidyl-prolyl cis-trans isomerase cyp8 [Boothiomyces sp. JEL0838]